MCRAAALLFQIGGLQTQQRKMYNTTKRQLSERAFLFPSNIEFVKRWRSGRRSRLFVESVKGEAFLTFSTFLGKPGTNHLRRSKMASREETQHMQSEAFLNLMNWPRSGTNIFPLRTCQWFRGYVWSNQTRPFSAHRIHQEQTLKSTNRETL